MKVSIEELYSIYLNHKEITTDSRSIKPGCLFFALKGATFNGNAFAATALKNGAAYAVIDDPSMDTQQTLLVQDVLEALQQLALHHRLSLSIPVIGITGTNGKTTTKELISTVLASHFRVTYTQGNLNNHIGVPLTLLSITDNTDIAVVEMGANHPGEIAFLCNLARPDYGLITNIGKAHLEGFGGFDGVIRTKSELYAFLRETHGKAFVNGDNALLMERSSGIERILYGKANSCYASGEMAGADPDLVVKWINGNEPQTIRTNLVGAYNFENVMAAVCTGMHFGVPAGKIIHALEQYVPSNNRSQTVDTGRNQVIMDAYNANPSSMQAALENFRNLKAGRKMVVLGDMLELGQESQQEHGTVLQQLQSIDLDNVLLVGPEFQEAAGSRFTSFADSTAAREWLRKHSLQGYTILVKGSRGIQMEKVLEAL